MLGPLPKTWDSALLDRLIVYVLGGDWGKNIDYDDPDYVCVRCIRASELRDWENEHGSTAALRKIRKSSLASRELRSGDIVVEVSGGGPEQPVGRTALINPTALAKNPDYPKICTNFFRLLRPAREMDSSFLNLYLKFFYKTGKIAAYQGGSNNLRNLRFNDYLTIRVPIPPAAEQRRVVAKIEELFSELDKGVESLKTARAKLNVYRQTVLKHAFEGKLTAQWREENRDKLETPEQLLARIKQEREARYEQQLQEWKTDVKKWEDSRKFGKRPQRPKKWPEATSLPHDVTAKLPPLPEGWLWARLGDISEVSGGLTKNQKRNSLPRRMKYLRVANVYADKILTDDIHEIGVTDSEAKAVALNVGDMLIVEGNGSVEQIGRVAVWDGQLHVCGHQNHLIRARLSKNFPPRFFLQFLLSPMGRDLIVREASSTSGLHTLSISKVSNLVVPVASFAEESATVARIEERLSKVDKMLEDIDTQLVASVALRHSILKRAFASQLVAQDPRDEPASALLDRIRAEREQAEKNNHSKKTKKKKTIA